jgi:hypothetical protein
MMDDDAGNPGIAIWRMHPSITLFPRTNQEQSVLAGVQPLRPIGRDHHILFQADVDLNPFVVGVENRLDRKGLILFQL